MSNHVTDVWLGIDFGTSGARAISIDSSGNICASSRVAYPSQTTDSLPQQWRQTLGTLLADLPLDCRQCLRAIAIDGTSSTMLLCDEAGVPIAEPLMYNDGRAKEQAQQLRSIAPVDHVVLSSSSSLAKLLWLCANTPDVSKARYFLSQADWLGFLLHGQLGVSDYHNSLKLGYDVADFRYPDWLLNLSVAGQAITPLLPKVLTPGTAIAPIQPEYSARFQIPATCQILAGTTDSIAAFMASPAREVGDAVTSLGSTLVLKLLSDHPVADSRYGIYSHRFGENWLVGGASNSGGAVLRQYFTDEQLKELSEHIDPKRPSNLDYYPLPKPGERFPINDPELPLRLTPRPEDDAKFLHGLFEGMARIEARGYQLLQELGASPLKQVHTAGGGARNSVWTAIRTSHLALEPQPSLQTEAAFGTARLATGRIISKEI